ncbi:MAG: hypothetical protein NXH91_12170 [Phyllobacteriaceae bacterium]|nr:hypothetical protein [Phyllobacteriaceae bacterium]
MSEARSITRALKGRWHGRYGMVCCPAHQDRTPSCKVGDGVNGPIFHCFAGCDWRDVRRSVERMGLLEPWRSRRKTDVRPLRPQSPPPSRHDEDVSERRDWARSIWDNSGYAPGTLGDAYLRRRSIDAALHPGTVRFHPGLKEPSTGRKWPALVFAYTTLDGEFDGIQRIFLDPDTAGKAPVETPKLSLGTFPGSMIRLAPIAAPRDDWPFYGPLGLIEGPEDGYSAMAMFGVPVWVAGGGEKIAMADLPAPIERLIIFGDNGTPGARFARKAVFAHADKVLRIEGAPQITKQFPPETFDDFNAQAMAGNGA